MKPIVKIGLPCVVMLALVVAAISPATKPIAPFEREQTKGNVRVVLLKVERSTIFTAEGIRDPQPGKSYPVPVFGFVYMVEALGEETVTNWIAYETVDDITIDNRRLRDASDPENLIAGGSGGLYESESRYADGQITLPKSINKKRRVIYERYERAALPGGSTMRLSLVAGFNREKQTFVFDGIRLH